MWMKSTFPRTARKFTRLYQIHACLAFAAVQLIFSQTASVSFTAGFNKIAVRAATEAVIFTTQGKAQQTKDLQRLDITLRVLLFSEVQSCHCCCVHIYSLETIAQLSFKESFSKMPPLTVRGYVFCSFLQQ